MQNLCDQITAQQCHEHKLPLERICIEAICTHPQRGMCRRCPRAESSHNIKNLFEFFSQQQPLNSKSVYQEQAQLFQQFLQNKNLIIEYLENLQTQLEFIINSICSNIIVELKEQGYLSKCINQSDTQTLGELFSKTIQFGRNDSFQMKDQINTQEKLQKVIDLTEWFKGFSSKLVQQFQGKYPTTQVQQQLQRNTNVVNVVSARKVANANNAKNITNIVNVDYRISKIQKIDGICWWLCLDHTQTKLVVAIDKSISIFTLSDSRRGIGSAQQPLIGHTEWISRVKFNHNSTQIASCSYDKLIITWNLSENGNWIKQDQLDSHTDYVNSVCYNHNSKILASGSNDEQIHIYIIYQGKWKITQKLTEHNGIVYDVSFNHDSTLLASGSADKSIILWECNSYGEWILKQKLTEHIDSVVRVSFNANSSLMVSGSYDNSIKIWSMDNQNIWKCCHTLIGHTDQIRSVQFNQESNMIVSGSRDDSIKLWKVNGVNKWECKQTIYTQVRCAITNSDSSMIISGADDQEIHIYKQ